MADIVLARPGVEAAEMLAGLCAQTFKEGYAHLHTPENLEAYCAANCSPAQLRATLADPKQACVLALRGGRPVGFSVAKNHPCPVALAGPSAELKQIYVLPEAFGDGLARLLYDDACATMRGWGAEHVWLAVADINARAQGFYRKLAFADVGVGPTFDVGTDRVTSRLMARPL